MNCGQAVVKVSDEDSARHTRMASATPESLAEKLRTANQLSGERRTVTAVFVDVVNSTALAHQLSPEAYEDVISGAFELACPIVYRFEGTIALLQDDELLIFFGAPVAHEDDPVRAVHAALALLADTRAYAEQIQQKYGIDFAVRISLSTGPVILGPVDSSLRYKFAAQDGSLNLAAQVESAKMPMSVNISEATYRFIAPFFECIDLGLVEAAGLPQPVHIYQVQGVKDLPGTSRGLSGLHSVLVGREQELATLSKLIQLLQAGLGRAVIIMGEPGIGKTRLVTEWKSSTSALPTASHTKWVEGVCVSYGQSLPYHLISSLVRSLAGISVTANEFETRSALIKLVDTYISGNGNPSPQVGANDIFPYLGNLLSLKLEGEAFDRVRSLDPQALQSRTQSALRLLLQAMATQHPLVIVLEDLHWADPSSVEYLIQLVPLTTSERILFALLMRAERESPTWRLTTLMRETLGGSLTEISLQALTEAQSRKLIANLLQVEALPKAVREMIQQKAEGNPFFVEEVIRMLIDRGVIVRKGNHWSALKDIQNVTIPDNLESLLIARIDRLPEDVKQTLRVAAVIGRQFPVKILEQVLMRERSNHQEGPSL
jgi:class 3 adenylate cyclase